LNAFKGGLRVAFFMPITGESEKKAPAWWCGCGELKSLPPRPGFLEARVRIELTIEVLQTSALPLGYRAGRFKTTALLN
jgi:hypothetical protein